MCFWVSSAVAAVFAPLDFHDLLGRSRVAAVVQVVESSSFSDEQTGGIFTRTVLLPLRMVKGQAQSSFEVVEEGGVVNGLGLRVDASPQFREGEVALVFLTTRGTGSWRTVGMAQGKFAVRGGIVWRSRLPLELVLAGLDAIARGHHVRLQPGDISLELAVEPYTLLGISWPASSLPVHFVVNELGTPDVTNEFQVIQSSFATWSRISRCYFRSVYDGATAQTGNDSQPDGLNLVKWADLGPGILGKTYTWYYPSTHEIIEADIAFNTDFTWATSGDPTKFDLQSVATHEAGHVLGIGHSDVQWATMWPTGSVGQTHARTLHGDDIRAASAIYPVSVSVSYASVSPSLAVIGESATISVKVTNTGSNTLFKVWLRARIRKPDNAIVETTKAPAADPATGIMGLIDFGSSQGGDIASGASRTFQAAYTFSTSSTSYTYVPGWHKLEYVAWLDGYPDQLAEDNDPISTRVGAAQTSSLAVQTFADVPLGDLFRPYIDALVKAGVTSGCLSEPKRYCPGDYATRAQMAKFLCKAAEKTELRPVTPTFSDVPASHQFYGWIERLADATSWGGNAPTSGCTATTYCPADYATRAQMAKFLCKAAGKTELPRTTPTFSDVPASHQFYGWIERLADDASWGGNAPTSGCTATTYCPGEAVTRAEMAKLLVRTFGIQL
jgi:hypothetical protein